MYKRQVLGELLADRRLVPDYRQAVDYFMVPVTERERRETLRIAHALRERGHSVAYALRDQSVGKQMKAATREGARTVLLLGPDEMARGCIVARNMETGEETDIALSELA